MKTIILSALGRFLPLLFLTTSPYLSAQFTLDASTTIPRFGDCLVKQQVVYKSPGDSGTGIIWDFSNLENINGDYELRYIAQDPESDIITGIEHRTMFYYDLSGDTLRALGYENPQTVMTYHNAETVLAFPFPYGRSITDYFNGTGNYCDQLDIHLFGKAVVTADATGQIVLPSGDTLQHVLRVHTSKKMISQSMPTAYRTEYARATSSTILRQDSIDRYLANDSSLIESDTWRWYAEGYRYPVFESIRSIDHGAGKASGVFFSSFYYPPHEQYYELENDPENQEKRNETEQYDKAPGNPENEGDRNEYQDDIIHYTYNIDGTSVVINYLLKADAEVSVSLYDFQGRQLTVVEKVSHNAGTYQERLALDGLPEGEYLLRISVGDKVYGEKILNHSLK